jgi:hypothetical protein
VLRTIILRSVLAVICGVGLALALSWAGPSPIGGDPELMYKPIKFELARSLAVGRLPFWSNRFGIGVPLVAESHVAAFYPPNWLLYRIFDVHTAYRMGMWLHWFALAATTFAYARTLGISQPGSVLAAVSFTLCGFQAAHIVHEPFYYLMPYMPLCLLLAHRYMTSGNLLWISGLALAWGTQLTLGHFQIQMWTAGLVVLFSAWRVWTVGENRYRVLWRVGGLCMSLLWGVSIAWVQLRLTWELTGVSGFVRPAHLLSPYSFPPAHWAQFALPEVFLGLTERTADNYWGRQGTTAGEACAYAGILVWILAFVGIVAKKPLEGLKPWRIIVPLSLVLATMPGWWPDGFLLLMKLPGLGWFRAPARYTLLTCLGLALLAGRGLDRAIIPRRFWTGLTLAIISGALAWCWSIYWTSGAEFRTSALAPTLVFRLTAAGLTWILALAAVIAWRQDRVGAWAPLAVVSLELVILLFVGPVVWIRADQQVETGPVLRRLAQMQGVGLVGGRLQDLPVAAGITTAYPYLGITAPPPNYLLERATSSPSENDTVDTRWIRRLGVTHEVWGSADSVYGTKVIARIVDPLLDQLMTTIPTSRRGGLGPWTIVQTSGPFPPAWIAQDIHTARDWKDVFYFLSGNDRPNEAWFEPGDGPASFPELITGSAHVKSWNGTTAVVEHDGPCILIVRRAYYPGWSYQVDNASKRPVLKVNFGLQGVPLLGSGTRRITFQYSPTGLPQATAISLTALASALIVVVVTGSRFIRINSPAHK